MLFRSLVPEDSPAAFARALTRLLLDPEARQRLAEEGRQYAAEWSDERLAARLASFYRRIVATHARGGVFGFSLLPM